MKYRRLIIWALLVVLLLAAPLPALWGQDDLQEQTLLLTFIPNVQFAPVYVALEEGYFAEAGFDITLQHLDEPVVVDLIAAGQHDFGVVSGEQVIMSRAAGRPVVYVYAWFHEYPIAIVVADDAGISTVADLAGLRVGIPGRFGASYSGFTALVQAAGMTESDVQLEEIGFVAPEVFCQGRVDAAVVYVNNEPLQIASLAAAGQCGPVSGIEVLRVAEAVDLVSNGLITSEAMIAQNPETVRALVAAYDRGVQYAVQNPARAYLHALNYVENLPISSELRTLLEVLADEQDALLAADATAREIAAGRDELYETLADLVPAEQLVQLAVLMETVRLWESERPGYSPLEAWQAMQDTLLTMGMVAGEIVLEEAFTYEFLPDAE